MEEPTLTNNHGIINGELILPSTSPDSPGPSILKGLSSKQKLNIAKRQASAVSFLSSISLGVPDPIPPPDIENSLISGYPPLTPRPQLSHSITQYSANALLQGTKRRPSTVSYTDVRAAGLGLDDGDVILNSNTAANASCSVPSQISGMIPRHESSGSNSDPANESGLPALFSTPANSSPRGTPRSMLRNTTNNDINPLTLDLPMEHASSPTTRKQRRNQQQQQQQQQAAQNRQDDTSPRHVLRPADLLTGGANSNDIAGRFGFVESPNGDPFINTLPRSISNHNNLRASSNTNNAGPTPLGTYYSSRDLVADSNGGGSSQLGHRRSSGSINSVSGRQQETQIGAVTKFFGKKKDKKNKKRDRVKSIGDRVMDKIGIGLSMDKRKKAESFAINLESAGSLQSEPDQSMVPYDPFFFEDPEIVPPDLDHLTNATKAYFMGSLVDKRAENVKREMNEHFREAHPEIDQSLTLSQVRNLKRVMLDVGRMQDMEVSSVACAYVYLEKLILKNHVSKLNRKLIAACCLLLAAKVNDPKEFDYAELLEAVDKEMDISPREVYAHEFQVYAALEFNLFLPAWEIYPHMQRILQLMEMGIDEYLHGRKFFLGNS
ncbi:hypothetical protein SmJEL517_g03102 [Synchytrium microbalum]|uniref:Cyclin N-terminal domain-containing protein n=1 Tax=Synchytrium microbalum TaxID=1806994 RepID=A0A507C9H9_9FUNG|nr:uncharacterized protein SmJEL517_g03102 [Synchytrium microbalum]TPX34203.1 hypothetical protein SmJEL517_g03102 [Synchytrium microbalum]